MNTISTKSRNKKSYSGNTVRAARPQAGAAVDFDQSAEISASAWRISAIAVLIAGAFLRLFNLSLVPLHHDEGVNGNFLVTLVREGKYFYDPQNYHGPTLYYFSAIIPWTVRFFGGKAAADNYGLTTFNIRLVTALFGIATILLALMLRKRLGTIGALSAAGLIAISPGAVYLSRYFIHESLYVFFTFGIVVAALKYFDTGRSLYLILGSISAALMVATKETWIINGPVLLIAFLLTILYCRARFKLEAFVDAVVTILVVLLLIALAPASLAYLILRQYGFRIAAVERVDARLERFGGLIAVITIALVAFSVFILVNVFFYSSFFTNYPKGVSDALKTLNLWRQRTHEHEHPWYQYTYWLLQEEGALMILAGLGALIAVWRANNRLAVFLSLWSFGLLAAYSLVGYKTPWIGLNFIVPLALTSGYTLDVAYQKLREFQQSRAFIAIAVLLIAFCGYQLYQLNFVHYDDDQLPYVYAHTKREMLTMVNQIERIANKNGTGTDTGIAIVSPDYWPLPWYFRNYTKVGYYQQIVPTNEPIIIGSMAQEDQLKATYGDRYDAVNSGLDEGAYPLRPGVDLLLYVRRDVKR